MKEHISPMSPATKASPGGDKVALVGLGLLGASLGLAIRQRQLATRVAGYVRRPASLEECSRLGVADEVSMDLRATVRDADVVILCTPLGQMRLLVEQMLPALKPGAIVTDVGSVKVSVVSAIETLVRDAGAHFLGSHPMAGSEKTGPSAARPDLFENAVCIITPTDFSEAWVVRRLEDFWGSLGMRLLVMPPARHDVLVARCSHLTHVLAASLANLVLDPELPPEQATVCASGFRDTTRVASGSPEMWRDIALANREQLSLAISTFSTRLKSLQDAIVGGDAKAVETFFAQAKERRDRWRAQGASPSPE
jgi:prephenate dehydrogenase